MTQRWLLPEQLEDLLPAEARVLEAARRRLLDLFHSHGYELVSPPALEYMESLLTGSGEDADLLTFKVVDQLSGRLLGLRADITPQVARIDAHRLDRAGVSRLCYAGHVYHALVTGAGASRAPYQVGAELFGHGGLAADLEVQGLLLNGLDQLGLRDFVLDLGHVGIFRSLTEGLEPGLVTDLLAAMHGKNIPRIDELTEGLEDAWRTALRSLPLLCGGVEVLGRARHALPALPGVLAALDALEEAARHLQGRARLEIDLAELRGYSYHSGMVFAVYAAGYPGAVARGGRYDAIGLVFGRARAATGFSIDLRDLLPVIDAPPPARCLWLPAVTAQALPAATLAAELQALRATGHVVIAELAGDSGSPDPRCAQMLWTDGTSLQVRPLSPEMAG